MNRQRIVLGALALMLVMVLAGCAAGDARFEEHPAGFWAGLWHGIILVVAFVISLFSDSVQVYQVNNAGNIYNLGFVLGVLMVSGSSASAGSRKKKKVRDKEEWEQITRRAEVKIKAGIKRWLEDADAGPQAGTEPGAGGGESEWREIAKKVEEKIKRELRNWSEDEPR